MWEPMNPLAPVRRMFLDMLISSGSMGSFK